MGCNSNGLMSSFFNGLFNPSELGSYGLIGREGTLDIRSSLSLQDAPTGVMGVSDPQPEDLVPIVEEYEYQIGDALNIRVYELLQRGTETALQVVLDETGSISIPVLGRLEVGGLTLPEIEAELADQLVSREILVNPELIVEPAIRRKLSYTVYGTIAGPNLYPLGQYDLRLLDAINIAGGLVDSVTEIYVVRNQALPDPVMATNWRSRGTTAKRRGAEAVTLSDGYGSGARHGSPADPTDTPPSTPSTQAGQQELIDVMLGETSSAPAAPQPEVQAPASQAVPQWIYKNGAWVEVDPSAKSDSASPPDSASSPTPTEVIPPPARQELIETMTGEPSSSAPAAPDAGEPVSAGPTQPRWIYYNGKWIETEAPDSAPAVASAPVASVDPPQATQPSIDWAQVAGVSEQRVIKISAGALRDGDGRHNIVVRPGDAIRLASGEFGEYYIMGHVFRVGAYSLTGRAITLKTAVAAAGNLSPLAWPQHCTVYRRLGDREQMIQVDLDAIFAGKEQDFFLKKDDLVLVGTHPVSPFLAVLRSAFRMSYGFGFVYDRNFADIDRYSSKVNPANQQSRFPNLFQ
ncbi:MAG: hypothetical protein GY842_02195 [bacterium]|nr:hypothetical protein [bacterium]